MATLMKNSLLLALTFFSISNANADEGHPRCMEWAEAGECSINPGYMWQHCRRQCEVVEQQEHSALEGIESFFDLTANDIDGNEVSFKDFEGQYTVITNVASYCGYTESHYSQLVQLYSRTKHTHKISIVAFPCNQFGEQEPEDNSQIKMFAESKGK